LQVSVYLPVSVELALMRCRGNTNHLYTIMSKQRPSVDIGRCILCGGCLEVAPTVFRYNEAFGFVEVIELVEYPRRQVDEAIMLCPVTCIEWEEE